MSGYRSDEFRRRRKITFNATKRQSRAAVAALVLSLLVVVPLAPLAAVILGLAALAATAGSNVLKGKLCAVAAVLLGLVFTAGQVVVGYAGYGFNERAHRGPQSALSAGFAGQTDQFVDAFHNTTGAPSSAADAATFIDELRGRYGDFIDGQIVQPISAHEILSEADRPQLYRLYFLNKSVMAEATVVLFDDAGPSWPSNRIGYLRVRDAQQGDLTFPARTRVASHP